jgi:hypothetical protein
MRRRGRRNGGLRHAWADHSFGPLLAVVVASALAAVASAVALRGCDVPAPKPPSPASTTPLPAIDARSPLVGSNYTHVAFPACSWNDNGILANGNGRGLDRRVARQLEQMRRSGVETLRTIVWHMTATGRNRWGVIPSAGGRLIEPYRSRLVAYAGEVRRLGFRRLTVVMGPQWSNSPMEPNYDARRFDENWAFLMDVRDVVKSNGPADTRIDLLNEGAPSRHLPKLTIDNMTRYIRQIWDRYGTTYGTSDATVSVIGARTARDRGERLQSLIDLLRSSRFGPPRWFDVHLNYAPAEAAYGLHDALAVLRVNGLDQPVVLGELPYDDPAVADALRPSVRAAGTKVEEVIQWFDRGVGSTCNASPPYRAHRYHAFKHP